MFKKLLEIYQLNNLVPIPSNYNPMVLAVKKALTASIFLNLRNFGTKRGTYGRKS